jgi:hypothetical protein
MALGRTKDMPTAADEGGRRAALLRTLIETARLNDVNVQRRDQYND